MWQWLELLQFEFVWIGALCAGAMGFLAGSLSPLVVLGQRSYIGESLAHVVFPGVVGGLWCSQLWGEGLYDHWWALGGAILCAFGANSFIEFVIGRLKLPPDGATVVVVSGFFGAGVALVTAAGPLRVDLHRFLFGDVLALSWADVGLLWGASLTCSACVLALAPHFGAWVADPHFAQLAGYRVVLVKRLFPLLLTGCVLVGTFTVGGLMVASLLALPAVLRPRGVIFSVGSIALGLGVALGGLMVALALDLPVGACVVVLGLFLVGLKSVFMPQRVL